MLDYYEWHGTSPSAARRFLISFEQTCSTLATHPRIGRKEEPSSESPQAKTEIRRLLVRRFPKYIIFYKIDEASILIQRILHAARNPSIRLTDPS